MHLANGRTLDVASLLWGGIEAGIQEGLVHEADKVGVMRGGSQGLFLDVNTVVGTCHRAALARMIGGEPEREADWVERHLMFDSGHANEDSWVANLARTWEGPILREEEIQVQWEIDGVPGTGRPDIVLCSFASAPGPGVIEHDNMWTKPELGIELKQISSVSTARDVLFADGAPKLEHAVQAGRYMKELGVPWQIWYTLPFVIPVPDWNFIYESIPAKGAKYSERVDYGRNFKSKSAVHTSDAWPTKIQPTAVGYHLRFEDGQLHYCRVGEETEGWFPTIVTEEGLDDFWRFTLDVRNHKDLGPRVANLDIHGNKAKWDKCSYCSWQPICDAHEDDYDGWEDAVRARIPKLDTKK